MRFTTLSLAALLLAGCPKTADTSAAVSSASAAASDAAGTTTEQPMKGPLPDAEGEPDAQADAAEAAPPELVGNWQLAGIAGMDMPTIQQIPTLTINEDGSVNGFSGVNKFAGTLSSTEGTLFGALAGTKMAGSPELMGVERAFLDQMSKVTAAKVEGDQMSLTAGDEPALTFTRAATE